MSDIAAATEGSLPPADSQYRHVEVGGEGALSPREAARALAQNRFKNDAQDGRDIEQEAIAAAETPQPEQVSEQVSEEEIPASAEATGEVEAEAIEPEGEAPASFELPRSWSKDEAEVWNQIPPEAQEVILRRAEQGSKTVRQTQNEVAEQRKALEARQGELDNAINQLGQISQQSLAALQAAQSGEFADIRSQADIQKMANEDWPRFSKWQAHQIGIQQEQQRLAQIQQYQAQQYEQQYSKWANEQDTKFRADFPETPKPEVYAKRLTDDFGFTGDELGSLWGGKSSLPLRDARTQKLIYYANKGLEAEQAAKSAKAKVARPIPHVQRPGSPTIRTPDRLSQVQSLDRKLSQSGDRKDAVALILAQRAARDQRR